MKNAAPVIISTSIFKLPHDAWLSVLGKIYDSSPQITLISSWQYIELEISSQTATVAVLKPGWASALIAKEETNIISATANINNAFIPLIANQERYKKIWEKRSLGLILHQFECQKSSFSNSAL